MDEMRVGSLVGTLTCHEFLLRTLARAIQDPLPPPFLRFSIWISFLGGINPPPHPYKSWWECQSRDPPLHPSGQEDSMWLTPSQLSSYLFPGLWILGGETCWNLSIAAVACKEDHQFCSPGLPELPQFLSLTKPGSAHFLLISLISWLFFQ